MVVSKRKKDNKEAAPATPEQKRTKIQAQRKFASGDRPPSSAYLTYNLTSGSETPVKEKSQERELLPNLRPNTEDFLTFLCFRGTSALPKELDFQNTLNQPSTSKASNKPSKASPEKKPKDLKTDSKKKAVKTETVTSTKEAEVAKPSKATEKDPKTGFMPFAVRKRAEIHPAKVDKKKLQSKKKQAAKSEETVQDNEASNGPRTTRANPIEDKPADNLNKSVKSTKRKSAILDASLTPNTPEKKVELSNFEKVPTEITKKETKTNSNKKSAKKEVVRQTRLSAVRNTSSASKEIGNGDYDFDKYFTSDEDDEPLVKSEPKNKKAKLNDVSVNSIAFSSEANTSRNNITNDSKSQEPVKSNRGRKKKVVQPEPEKKVEKEVSPAPDTSKEKKKVGRKKKLNADLEIANSQANTTDLSENETRGRPMRKTKEAATIYMELIGRKLTLQDSSDNDSSLDSLEVPNLKRVELLENELKANCEKAKEAEAEKKKQETKQETKKVNNSINTSQEIKIVSSNKRTLAPKIEKKIESDDESDDTEKKLERSFSDSDEEPLATKVTKQPAKPMPKKRGRKSNVELAEIAAKKIEQQREVDAADERTLEVVKKLSLQMIVKKSPVTGTQKVQQKEMEAKIFTKVEPGNSKNFSATPTNRTPLKPEPAIQVDDDEFVKGFDSLATKPVASPKPSINLLPSKEESEKIFGIASVTLAQSCGPLDTKCTLGKCGSVHVQKPPPGPTVLTESALGASLSPKDRRKSKVNMTREQIQKWLEEASWTPIPDDDTETLDLKTTSKASSSSVGLSKYGDDSQSSSFMREKTLGQQSPSTSGKEFKPKLKPLKPESPITTKFLAKVDDKIKLNFPLKSEEVRKESPSPLAVPQERKTNGAKTSSPINPTASSSFSEKKAPVYQQQNRRTPVYKTDNKPKSKLTPMLPKSFGAFSPENEHSIYSFDKEDEDIPIPTTPFRRSNSKAEGEIFHKPAVTPSKQQAQQSHVSLTLSPDDNRKSASISVEMTDESKKESEKLDAREKEGDNDSDSEGHTFYIPLQASNVSGSKTIQGVAVKLGTEGAEGPNQRIIMHAKLVTKPRANAAPLPESMTNVQELVKSLMASKETNKPVPCATVQPRFKSNDGAGESSLQPEASTSSMIGNQRNSQAPKLGTLTEAPIFRPTEKEFQDPIEYIERITPIASRFGICRIIPPDSFKPECRVSDEMRFTAYNQYVHKMLHRWGPSSKEFSAIKKYLATQSIVFQRPPLIAGVEVDLPRLYHTVQELGGLKEVIEKKKWAKVAEDMCIPKTAHDRVTKLDDIYCKYLLPYDTLSHIERQKLFDEVEADWAKREAKARRNADKGVDSDEQSNEESEESDEDEDEDDNASMECMVKGRSMALSQFYRIARNMVTLWFKTPEPTVAEIETEYWRHVAVRDSHVSVHYGSIDSSGYGYGFPMPGPKTKLSPCSKHPWNLKVLTNNNSSILRSLGPVMGVTVPTLHVAMLFSSVCWYRDPHGLPWIEYLHTGASKIWYAVPDNQSSNFRTALTSLVPSHCQNKNIWLSCDTAMVPPYMLTDRNVSLCRTEQQPGQFVVVFPRAYTSSVCTGYTVSESVYFATNSWLDTAHLDFKDIQESCEPTMFSLEQLLFAIANDQRSKDATVTKILPMLQEVYESEKLNRQAVKDAGVTASEKIHEIRNKVNAEELECNYCRANLHISWIKLVDDDEENVYCLKHSLKYLNGDRIQARQCKLMFTYTIEEIEKLIKKLKVKVSSDADDQQSTSFGENSKSKNKGKINQKNYSY